MNVWRKKRFKFLSLVLVALGIALSAYSAERELYRFTDSEGRSFRGEVKAFNERTEVVTIRRLDGKTGSMKLSAFAEKDQQYIRKWALKAGFEQGVSIVPQFEFVMDQDASTSGDVVNKNVWKASFNVVLSNPTPYDFGEISVEYCIFYRQGVRKEGESMIYSEGVCYGSSAVKTLKSTEKTNLTTQAIRLFSEKGRNTIFGSVSCSDANVRGIWVKMTSTLKTGETVVREFRTSDDKLWEWHDQSFGVGLNRTDAAAPARKPRTPLVLP